MTTNPSAKDKTPPGFYILQTLANYRRPLGSYAIEERLPVKLRRSTVTGRLSDMEDMGLVRSEVLLTADGGGGTKVYTLTLRGGLLLAHHNSLNILQEGFRALNHVGKRRARKMAAERKEWKVEAGEAATDAMAPMLGVLP